MSQKGYLIVEGHGEVEAAQNLVARMGRDLAFPLPWTEPRRIPNLHQWEAHSRGGLRAGAELFRAKPDCGALLILKDEDDGCPKELAPEMGERLRSLNLPFPTAYILLKPEYEVLFLPCLDKMEMNLPNWDKGNWEARRGIKEWLSSQLPQGQSYKPTTDQLRMTRRLDLSELRRSDVPCFGTLERAMIFLRDNLIIPGSVYP
jgi:hypothetical protein